MGTLQVVASLETRIAKHERVDTKGKSWGQGSWVESAALFCPGWEQHCWPLCKESCSLHRRLTGGLCAAAGIGGKFPAFSGTPGWVDSAPLPRPTRGSSADQRQPFIVS